MSSTCPLRQSAPSGRWYRSSLCDRWPVHDGRTGGATVGKVAAWPPAGAISAAEGPAAGRDGGFGEDADRPRIGDDCRAQQAGDAV
ncbi:MAG: hypothetical protein EBZ59_04620 [Planctomycetia bacterium]|nr:hypothetical protein [Planctomycetia bacterium]